MNPIDSLRRTLAGMSPTERVLLVAGVPAVAVAAVVASRRKPSAAADEAEPDTGAPPLIPTNPAGLAGSIGAALNPGVIDPGQLGSFLDQYADLYAGAQDELEQLREAQEADAAMFRKLRRRIRRLRRRQSADSAGSTSSSSSTSSTATSSDAAQTQSRLAGGASAADEPDPIAGRGGANSYAV